MAVEPIYDRELALQLAGKQADLAGEMLSGLIRTLPGDIQKIREALSVQDSSTLMQTVHRLHGLVCYCGVPRLKTAIAGLETELRNINSQTMEERLTAFFNEANVLLKSFLVV